MPCPICCIVLPDDHAKFWPCGIAPRHYVNDFGFIVGIIQGCPYEPERPPDYLREDVLPRMYKTERDVIELRAKETVNAQSYEDLWSARHGENDHLDFDAKSRLGIWYAANSGSLHYTHKGRVRRSKAKSC